MSEDDALDRLLGWGDVHAKTRSHVSEFLGLDEDEAHDLALRLGLVLRVITPDTDGITLDLHPTRMTVTVEAGRVTRAEAY